MTDALMLGLGLLIAFVAIAAGAYFFMLVGQFGRRLLDTARDWTLNRWERSRGVADEL